LSKYHAGKTFWLVASWSREAASWGIKWDLVWWEACNLWG